MTALLGEHEVLRRADTFSDICGILVGIPLAQVRAPNLVTQLLGVDLMPCSLSVTVHNGDERSMPRLDNAPSIRALRRVTMVSRLKFIVATVTGLCIFHCGLAAAAPFSVTSGNLGFPVEPSTTYSFALSGLQPPISAGILTINQTNGDFNNENETITVSFDGLSLGTHTFSLDNAPIMRSLSLQLPISLPDLLSSVSDGAAAVDLRTSAGVNQSMAASWLNVTLAYQVPEPSFGIGAICSLCLLRRRLACRRCR